MMNPMTSLKTYWSTLKAFLNNKKVPCIPPLLQDNKCNKFQKESRIIQLVIC